MTALTDHEVSQMPDIEIPYRYVPPYATRTAYHWIRRFKSGPAIPLWWNATWHQNGAEGWGRWAQPDRENQWEYCGACPSPDDFPCPQATEAPND